ncbi:MAG: hypothetical protein LUI10_04695 [Lachnospiraceae bacterium]|nr:hypothetical protein [Lachnospiraceae bacterium]
MEFRPIKDAKDHRVGDLSDDNKVFVIVRKECRTTITATAAGVFEVKTELTAA